MRNRAYGIIRWLLLKVAGVSLDLARQGLRESGWTDSHRRQQAVDADGLPLPWITYGAIHFLGGTVLDNLRVFEYGAGNSTKWWAKRVAEVVACEHDPTWAAQLSDLPRSASVLHRRLEDGYVESIRGRGPFDIVVIDGRNRVACAHACLPELSDDGIIVFDNSDRPEYQEAYDLLRSCGFRRLDFRGLGPIAPIFTTTSVFYRDRNCLGL